MRKLVGLMLILGAPWLLGMEVGSTEATMHLANPCYAGGENSLFPWLTQLSGHLVLLMGICIGFVLAVSKIKNLFSADNANR